MPDNNLNIFLWGWYGAWLYWQWLNILKAWSETCWETQILRTYTCLPDVCYGNTGEEGRLPRQLSFRFYFQTWKCELEWVRGFDSSSNKLLHQTSLTFAPCECTCKQIYFSLLGTASLTNETHTFEHKRSCDQFEIWCYKENFAIAAPVQQRLQQKIQNFIHGVRSYEREGPPNKIQPQYTTRWPH